MRERLAFGILIVILIILVAFTMAVLGRGEYAPSGTSTAPASSYALIGVPTG